MYSFIMIFNSYDPQLMPPDPLRLKTLNRDGVLAAEIRKSTETSSAQEVV